MHSNSFSTDVLFLTSIKFNNSINELKDVNEPQLETMDMAEGTKKHLKLISTAIFIIIGFVSVGLFCFYFIFA